MLKPAPVLMQTLKPSQMQTPMQALRPSLRQVLNRSHHQAQRHAAAWLLVATVALPVAAFEVVGDGIPQPLGAQAGDAERGRAIVANRQVGLCLLCHSGPFPEERFQGNLAPALDGAGTRWSTAQLRLRVADNRRINPHSLMPAFHRTEGLQRVGSAWAGRPVLDAQQVEDVVAFLGTLR